MSKITLKQLEFDFDRKISRSIFKIYVFGQCSECNGWRDSRLPIVKNGDLATCSVITNDERCSVKKFPVCYNIGQVIHLQTCWPRWEIKVQAVVTVSLPR